MSIQELISEDIKKAMLARESDKLSALRAVKSAIILESTKDRSSNVSDEIALKIINKLVKQRRDSAQIYNEQNRADLEKDELEQLKHLEVYLPQQLSKEEVLVIINEIISNLDASKISDMGKVMAVATKELSGKADGKLIASFVRERLQ